VMHFVERVSSKCCNIHPVTLPSCIVLIVLIGNRISGIQADTWWYMPSEAGTVTYSIQSNGKQIKEKCSFGVVVVSTYLKPYNVFIILLYSYLL